MAMRPEALVSVGKLNIIIMDVISSCMAFFGNLTDRLGNRQIRQSK